jgi:hypothetical protein
LAEVFLSFRRFNKRIALMAPAENYLRFDHDSTRTSISRPRLWVQTPGYNRDESVAARTKSIEKLQEVRGT